MSLVLSGSLNSEKIRLCVNSGTCPRRRGSGRHICPLCVCARDVKVATGSRQHVGNRQQKTSQDTQTRRRDARQQEGNLEQVSPEIQKNGEDVITGVVWVKGKQEALFMEGNRYP